MSIIGGIECISLFSCHWLHRVLLACSKVSQECIGKLFYLRTLRTTNCNSFQRERKHSKTLCYTLLLKTNALGFSISLEVWIADNQIYSKLLEQLMCVCVLPFSLHYVWNVFSLLCTKEGKPPLSLGQYPRWNIEVW